MKAYCRERSRVDFHEGACEGCGRKVYYSFWTPPRGAVACSEVCRRKVHAAIRRAKGGSREKTCTVCGRPFTAPRCDALTCSPACRQKAYRQRHAQRP
jgi:hypothetical protein